DCEKITVVVRRENPDFLKFKKVEQFVLDDFLLLNDQDVSGYTHAFSCLGTTIKKAGSKEAFYNIDFEINAHFADLFEMTETHLLLVSAMGAKASSPIFYNQVKGELEDYIQKLNLYRFSIIRPSLLLGDRNEKRFLEDVTQKPYGKFSHLVPNSFKYKPVTAEQVAHTMVEAAQTQTQKIEIYDNLRIQNSK
ncbi:MAG: nucleoside-diphosphate sugar epimerase, partial [Acinetobacter sp.]|nr:nucleoside-diphosphate sugar epimerase [Acinetobacter sp.]